MDVVVADLGSLLLRGLAVFATVGLPPAAVVDPAELLDVHVDQLAGAVTFVAQRGDLRCPDHLAGHRVALAQVGHLVAAQDPGHGPWGDTQLGAEPVLSATLLAA